MASVLILAESQADPVQNNEAKLIRYTMIKGVSTQLPIAAPTTPLGYTSAAWVCRNGGKGCIEQSKVLSFALNVDGVNCADWFSSPHFLRCTPGPGRTGEGGCMSHNSDCGVIGRFSSLEKNTGQSRALLRSMLKVQSTSACFSSWVSCGVPRRVGRLHVANLRQVIPSRPKYTTAEVLHAALTFSEGLSLDRIEES